MEAFRDIRRLRDRWFFAIIIPAALAAGLLVALDIPDLGSLNGDSGLSIMKSIAFVGLVTNGCYVISSTMDYKFLILVAGVPLVSFLFVFASMLAAVSIFYLKEQMICRS